MPFYKVGTVSVTNGSTKVTGAGTAFVANAPIGMIFIGPDRAIYEIVGVPSDTELTIDPAYGGATAANQAYKIVPTTQGVIDLATSAATLVASFAAVRDGIGQGLVPSGTVAAPGLRFSADQDTGLYRPGENQLGLVTAGLLRLFVGAGGRVGINTTDPQARLHAVSSVGEEAARFSDASTYTAAVRSGGAGVALLTGLGGSALALGADNVERVRIDTSGYVGIGTTAPTAAVTTGGSGASARFNTNAGGTSLQASNGVSIYFNQSNGSLDGAIVYGGTANSFWRFVQYDGGAFAERLRIDATGNWLVGVSSGSAHTLDKAVAEGGLVARISAANTRIVDFYGVTSDVSSSAAAAQRIGRNSSTGRSINAGGTVNASGADYAEYMRKARACGIVAKGQIVGIDADGRVTDRWSLAHSFAVKSTDPSYVGGDNWSPGPPPAEPLLVLPEYKGPAEPVAPAGVERELPELGPKPERPEQRDGEELMAYVLRLAAWVNASAAWVTAMDARPLQVEQLQIAIAADAAAQAGYEAALPIWRRATADHRAAVAAAEQAHAAALVRYRANKAAWDVAMEEARASVDRIAFSGQVPVNVAAGSFKPGDYVVASKGKDDAVVGLIVSNAAMRLPTSAGMRCDAVGKVWRTMDDGRAWCAVLIG